jgi:hypothetical protein
MDALQLQVLDQRVVSLVERDDVEVGLGLTDGQSPQVISNVEVERVAARVLHAHVLCACTECLQRGSDADIDARLVRADEHQHL